MAQAFPCEFCENFKDNFFTEHIRATASTNTNLILEQYLSGILQSCQTSITTPQNGKTKVGYISPTPSLVYRAQEKKKLKKQRKGQKTNLKIFRCN